MPGFDPKQTFATVVVEEPLLSGVEMIPLRPRALEVAEGELQVVHSASSPAVADTWPTTFPSFMLIRRLQRLARSGA